MAYKDVDAYNVLLYANEGRQEARIQMICEDGYRLYVDFKDPSVSMDTNSWNDGQKVGIANQPFIMYEHFLDLVRNEKPIRINFSTTITPPKFVIVVGAEPIGEEET